MSSIQKQHDNYSILKPSTSKDRVFNGIGENETVKLSKFLTRILANTYALYLKTQNLHWNATGPMFYSIHKQTEEQYQELATAIDQIAERIRALGVPCVASLSKYANMAEIEELDLTRCSMETFVDSLSLDHELMSRALREAAAEADRLDDYKTSDLITERIGTHEKYAWMWRATVAK